MADLRLSEEARADLENIRELGIELFGSAAAERHLGAIRQGFELLIAFPLAGQERPEFQLNIRSVSRRPHRILYLIDAEGVLIVRVIHQSRDVATALLGGH